jgi:RNA polymerase sigma-70 factor (ECF subfamily)
MTWSQLICEGLPMTVGDARFVEVYERYYRHVFGYCRRRVSADQVDDVVADTFLTAWRKIDQVPPGDECLPWLYGIAYRVLNHQWRGSSRRQRLNEKLTNVGAESFYAPEEYIVMRDESRLVLDALAHLKPTDQEILRLATWEELAQRDIALTLGISLGAVRQRLYEAKKNLTREYTKLEKKRIKPPAAQEGGARWRQ